MVEMKYLDTPVGLRRLNNGPLDESLVFNSNIDLLRYCADENGNIYDGQIVCVVYEKSRQPMVLKKCHAKTFSKDLYYPVPIFTSGSEVPIRMVRDNSTTVLEAYALVYYANSYTHKSGDLVTDMINPVEQTLGPSYYPEFDPSRFDDLNMFNALELCEVYGLNLDDNISANSNMEFHLITKSADSDIFTNINTSFLQPNPLYRTGGSTIYKNETSNGYLACTATGMTLPLMHKLNMLPQDCCIEIYVKMSEDARRVRGII